MTKSYRWVVAALLITASMINYIDRAALPIIAPLMSRDLHLNPAQLGTVFSAFFLGYAIFCFIGGYASDRFGPKRVYGLAMAFWSLFCGATAIVTGFAQLLAFRILFGVGEGPMGSVTNKTVRSWFPRDEVGLVMGLTPTGGNQLGAAIAGPIVGGIALSFGWRIPFVVLMLIGVLWIILWRQLVTDHPSENPRVSAAERELIQGSRVEDTIESASAVPPVGHYMMSPRVISVGAAFFASNYILYFFLSWMPSYLTDVRHLNVKEMSILTVIPWSTGLASCILTGLISDRILRRAGNGVFARKIILVAGLASSACCLFLGTRITSTFMAIAVITLAIAMITGPLLACWALLQEIVPASRIGGVGGYVHLIANLSGIIGPAITGFIIQYGGGYDTSFLLAGGVSMAAALAVLIFVDDRRTFQPALGLDALTKS